MTAAPAINQIICTLYDGTFYRGVVRQVNEKDSEVVVDFIDYGDSSAVKMSDCRNISEEIMKVSRVYIFGFIVVVAIILKRTDFNLAFAETSIFIWSAL